MPARQERERERVSEKRSHDKKKKKPKIKEKKNTFFKKKFNDTLERDQNSLDDDDYDDD